MNNFLDDFESQPVAYVGFWPRFGAQLLDGLFLIPVTLPFTFFNITDWKSILVLCVISFISTAYKPFMEFKYGATLGKIIVRIKVTNITHQKPTLSNILIRNVFWMLIGISDFFLDLHTYIDPAFMGLNSFAEYTAFENENSPWNIWFIFITFAIYLIESIFIWTDNKKRSLHDRLALTYVIRK